MKNVLNDYFKISSLFSIILFIFGLLLFINPGGVIVTISIIIGALAVVFGIYQFILYSKTKLNITLTSGVFASLAGIILITNTNILATIIPMIVGIGLILEGIKKIEVAKELKQNSIDNYMFIKAIMTLLVGIIFVINPIFGAIITTKIIGLVIIIYAILEIVDSIVIKNKVKKIDNFKDPKVIDVEVEEKG